jgi:nucleoid-associated protein YgaU
VLEPESAIDMSYTVVAGDSFWQIAKRQVEAHDATAPVRAVAVYWLELIETNLDELVVAGDPNLLLPGQVLQLPAFHPDGPS